MPGLKRELKLFDVFSIAAGAMISSGLFILPGLAYYKSGPAIVVAYLLAGILVIPSMLSQSELSTAMPKAGGAYFFIFRSLGANFGTLAGFSSWFSLALKSAFALVGIGAFASLIYPDITMLQIKLIATAFCIFFTILNIFGTKHAGRMQVLMVVFLFLILIFYIIKGIPYIDNNNFDVFMTGNIKTLFMTAGMIFISFGGLTKIASVAEEVKDPSRNIPLGMITAFVAVTLLYFLVVFVTVGILGDKLLSNGINGYSLTPISDGAQLMMGTAGTFLLSFAALLAFFSTANAGIMAASRNPMAMSQDQLIPAAFAKVNKKFRTPINSIIFTSLFIGVVIFLPLETLVKTASTMMLLLFLFVNISVIIMRESGIQNYRPKFKSPLYPWLQIFAIISYSFIIIEMGTLTLVITASFIFLSIVWFLFYGRIRTNRESALVQLVKRIKAKDLDTTSIDTELKEIIRERDEILEDRFDQIIENAEILDIQKIIDKEEFFHIVSENIFDYFETSCDSFFKQLMDRENESSTVLTENMAIPHIIIEGEKKFNILLARCKEGIYFSAEAPKVQIVFVIAGSRDERNFHLQALAAIAQIVQNSNFEKKWLSAKNPEALRDIVLLGERRRH
ncbi:MAG: amino acid permease [Candidatus Cloacimonadales bacterium]|nr:amino acid permease [Candidatus Cloacimonadales bacterium]